jgi:FkbM family methyltransferase
MLTARLRASLWRFRSLAWAERVFQGAPSPTILKRRLFGFDVFLDVSRSNVQRLLFLEGERFVAERSLVRSCLASGMRVVDVGANIGYYLLLFESVVGPEGSIDCFEPEPDNLVELERNVRGNRFTNVRVHPMAVGARAGTVSLRRGMNAALDDQGDLTAPIGCLDELVTPPVDFVKIDVEGYEGHVLAGATRLLSACRPTLFVEIHPGFLAAPYTVDAIVSTLSSWYSSIELFEIAPQRSLGEKIASRYLGRQVRVIAHREDLLAACRKGSREEPFWALCRAS